jgi:hypothetical protein
MAKFDVIEFIKWALPHSNNKVEGSYPLPYSDIAVDPWGYIFGTTGCICTQKLINAKRNIPNYKKWSDTSYKAATAKWLGKTVVDCQGLVDYYCKQDTNAKGNYANWCSTKSTDMSKIPMQIGVAVFHGTKPSNIHHVGFVCGFDTNSRPLVIEARGTNYGVVITRFDERGWNYWGKMDKVFEYEQSTEPPFFAVCGANKVNVRSGRGTIYKSIGFQNKGDMLLALPAVDGWCAVSCVIGDKLVVGYMYAQYVEKAQLPMS